MSTICCYPSDFSKNVRLQMTYTLLDTSIRGIWIGLLTGVVGATQVVCTLFTAIAADKISRVILLRIGGYISIVGIIATSMAVLVGNYVFLLLSMMIWGLYWSFTGPASDSLLADSIDVGNRSRVYSWSYTMQGIGRSVGPFVSVIMFATLGDTWKINECKTVMLVGLILLLIPTYLLFLYEDIPLKNKCQSKNNENGTGDSGDAELTSESQHGMLSDTSTHGIQSENSFESESQSESEEEIVEIDLNEAPPPKSTSTADSNLQNNNSVVVTSSELTPSKHFLCFPDVPHVPAMIAVADVISGLASGMTIQFFPIFFKDSLKMSPVQVSLLYTFTPLVVSSTAIGTQKLSKLFGRIQIAVLAKCLGISCFILFLLTWSDHFPSWISIGLFIIRTALMNSSKPLTTSAIMDTVPATQRIRWNSLEAINQASWAGSAVFGGYIIDKYGMTFNFVTTITMQAIGLIPLILVANDVPMEGSQIMTMNELWCQIKNYFTSSKPDESPPILPQLLNRIQDFIGFEFVDLSDDQAYSPVNAEMEMSQHDGERKGSKTMNPHNTQTEEEEDVEGDNVV